MPHIDMSDDSSIDYSDFEYQQTSFAVNLDADDVSGSPAEAIVQQDVDVLGGIGGLDNNEIAELAWLELVANIEHDQDIADQDVGSESSFAFALGANLPEGNKALPGRGPSLDRTVVSTTNVTEAGVTAQDSRTTSEDRIFALGRYTKIPAFDDEANGVGGGGAASPLVLQRPFRNMVGRGPVLDSSDNITAQMVFAQKDEIIDANASLDVHMVFDLAETSDAGRRFSVPE